MTSTSFFKSLISSDTIMASVAQRGAVVANFRLNGAVSHDDVLSSVRDCMKRCRGMVTVTLRNVGNGQVFKQTITLSPAPRQLELSFC